jgi:hypothetical protein
VFGKIMAVKLFASQAGTFWCRRSITGGADFQSWLLICVAKFIEDEGMAKKRGKYNSPGKPRYLTVRLSEQMHNALFKASKKYDRG